MAGEFDLIAALQAQLPITGARIVLGSGDDAAVVRAGGDRSVISVDTTVDGVHARLDLGDRAAAAAAFGWRALTTALSDLAAMGAPAGEAYVALGAPSATAAQLVPQVARGLGEAAREFGVTIAGGDLTASPTVFASVTVVGWLAAGQRPLTRAGARPGDLLGLSGPIGGAGGGLLLQQLGEADASGNALLASHLRPQPQLAAGVALRQAGASAAIDLSDGLLADAGHLARASGVALRFDPAAIPIAEGLSELLAEARPSEPPLAFAQRAGEDFALLVAVPPEHRAGAEAAGVAAWVGQVDAGAPAVHGLPATPTAGHDHFS